MSQKIPAKFDRIEALQAYDSLLEPLPSILWNLYKFQAISQQQIGDVYSEAVDRHKRWQLAGRYLSGLVNAGLVERVEPMARHNYKNFFTPTPSGMYVCRVIELHDSSQVRRVRQSKAYRILNSVHANHHVFLVDAMLGFMKAERRGEGVLQFRGDREECYIFPYMGSRRRILPDATCVWCTKDEAFNFWLELVNRQGSSREIVEKIQKYLFFSVAGPNQGDEYRRALGTNQFPVLLTVAVRRGQLPGLRQAIITAVLKSGTGTIPEVAKQVVVALACLEEIKRFGIMAHVWEPVLQRGGSLLRLDALNGLCQRR